MSTQLSTVVKPYKANILAASRLGQRALSETLTYQGEFSFPTAREECTQFVNQARKNLQTTIRKVEPADLLIRHYIRASDVLVEELQSRSHPQYPQAFITKLTELTLAIEDRLQSNLSHPQGTLPNTKETSTQNNNIAENSNSDNDITDSEQSPDDFQTPAARPRSSTPTLVELVALSGAEYITQEEIKKRIDNGETLKNIATKLAEETQGKHPDEVQAILTGYQQLKEDLNIGNLIRDLEETRENLKLRWNELDQVQIQYDTNYAENIKNIPVDQRLTIHLNEIDRTFFHGHITAFKHIYAPNPKVISKKQPHTNKYVPYQKNIPRNESDDTHTTIRHTTRTRKTVNADISPDSSDSEFESNTATEPLTQQYNTRKVQREKDIIPISQRDNKPSSNDQTNIQTSHPYQRTSTPNPSPNFSSSEIPRINNNESGHSILDVPPQNQQDRMDRLEEQIRNLTILLANQTAIPNVAQRVQQVNPKPNQAPETENEEQQSINIIQTVTTSDHLPKIDIPSFNGNIEDFPRFWELFTTIIDRLNWPNIAKFSYLLTKLEGEAAEAIKMIPMTGEGYTMAKHKLKNMFEDQHLLQATLEKKLDNVPKAQDNAESLFRTIHTAETIIQLRKKHLKSLDDIALIRRLANLFPSKVASKALKDRAARNNVELYLANIKTYAEDKKVEEITLNKNDSTVFYAHTPTSTDKCAFCKGTHRSQKCMKVDNISDRIHIIRNKNLCFSCLSPNHSSKRCKAAPCNVCNKPHHESICRSHSNNDRSRNFERNNRKNSQSTYNQNRRSPFNDRSSSRHSYRNNSNQRYKSKSPYRTHSGNRSHSMNRSQSRDSFRSNNSRRYRTPSRDRQSYHKQRRDPTPYNRDNYRIRSRSASRENRRTLKISETKGQTNLMIFPAHVDTKHGRKLVYGIIDTGSDSTFISERLVKQLNEPEFIEKKINIATFGNNEQTINTHYIPELNLYNDLSKKINISVTVFPHIIDNITSPQLSKTDKKFLHDHRIRVPEITRQTQLPIDVLIGLDNFHSVYKSGTSSYRLPSGLMLSPTFFGNILYGRENEHRTLIATTQSITVRSLMISAKQLGSSKVEDVDIERMWNLESIKIFDNITKNKEEESVLQNFMKTVRKENDGIHVSFPWKHNKSQLNSNFYVALARLRQLHLRLTSEDPKLWKKYIKLFETQLKANIIEEVPNWRIPPYHNEPVYYMPHRAVIKHSSKTTKVRIVMDASSKAKGQLSLNDVVHQGPSILPNIAGVILRSRCGDHLITSDIEKAFHQIHLNETVKDATRFLVPIDTDKPITEDNVKAYRHTRPAFGINVSPFLLAGGIYFGLDLFEEQNIKSMTEDIKNNLYVDNLVLPFDETHEGIKIYHTSKYIFKELKMNLREYATNNKNVRRAIAKPDKTEDNELKLLGIKWNVKHDTYQLNMTLGEPIQHPTKRLILKAAHTTYDPLGILTPLFIKPRHFIQKLWAYDYHWDSPLSLEHAEEWNEIHEKVNNYTLTLDRSIGSRKMLTSPNEHHSLNIFVDSSKIAFAAVAYLTTKHKNETKTEFLMAKHRLAPRIKSSKKLKEVMTIPRLELTSMVLGVKMAYFILEQSNIKFSQLNLFGDSSIALSWLISDKSHGVFVDNRTREIKLIRDTIKINYTITTRFFHVATEENPADFATRGVDKDTFPISRWINGPTFLKTSADHDFSNINTVKEFKTESPVEKITLRTRTNTYEQGIISYENKNYEKNLRIMAYAIRFIRQCRQGKRTPCIEFYDTVPNIQHPQSHIHPIELKIAENCIIRDIQQNVNIDNKLYKNLQLYHDGDGIIRANGRMNNLEDKDTANPILLPEYHAFTTSILQHLHRKNNHFGSNFIKSEFRRKYWSTRLTKQIVSCIRSCWHCKKLNAKPYKYPPMAQLPKKRMERSKPFEHIGIDLAGPFKVKEQNTEINTRYIALFTCFTTRAVHLEPLTSTSAQDFGLSLRKFISRRGAPKSILSDNASNFTATKSIYDSIRKDNPSLFWNTTWEFITPLSPWKGGMYERMIGLVKKALKSTLKSACSINIFDTLVTEAEAVVNMRPLSMIVDSIQDYHPLRPIDLLSPGSVLTTIDYDPDEEFVPTLRTHADLVGSLKELRARLDTFWHRWYNDYILNLREKHTIDMQQKGKSTLQPQKGDIVLMTDEKTHRNNWKLAVILELHPEETPRTATVRTTNTMRNTSKNSYHNKIMIRSINHLIPMEICETKQYKIPITISATDNPSIEHKNIESPGITETNKTNKSNDQAITITNEDNSTSTPLVPTPQESSFESEDIIFDGFKPHSGILRTHRHPRKSHKAVSFTNLIRFLFILATNFISITATSSPLVSCTTGGLSIIPNSNDSHITVCASDLFCIEHTGIDNYTALIPPDISVNPYKLKVRVSDTLHDPHIFQINCPAAPFCESINCFLCYKLMTNPDCWPRAAVSSTALIIWFTLFSIITSVCIIRKAFKGIRFIIATILFTIWKIIGTLIPTSLLTWHYTRHPSTTEMLPRWRKSKIPIIILIFSMIIHPASSCNAIYLGESNNTHCSDIENPSSCHNIQQVQISLNNLHSESCFLIGNSTKYIKLTVLEVKLTCEKNTILFTKNTTTSFQSIKRCPSMGSCSGDFCEKVKPSNLIPELHLANKYPGNSYCLDSCGFISCGCGLPAEGCLFYRIYQIPQDDLYEVFECTQWTPSIKLELAYPNKNKIIREKFEASPYIAFSSVPINFTITELSFNPDIQLTKRFITRAKYSKQMAIVPDTTRFSYICSENQACSTHDLCSCHSSDNQINCECIQNDVTSLFNNQKSLPLLRPSGSFYHHPFKNIPIFNPHTFNLQLLLDFQLTHIQFGDEITSPPVTITASTVDGCYNCAEGAYSHVSCYTQEFRDPIVLKCDKQSYVIKCTTSNSTNTIRLYLDQAQISMICTYYSHNKIHEIQLTGHLHFNHPLMGTISSYHIAGYKKFIFPDLSFILFTYKRIYLFAVTTIFTSFLLISCIFAFLEKYIPINSIPVFATLPFIIISLVSTPGKLLISLATLVFRILRWLFLAVFRLIHVLIPTPSKANIKTL